MRMNHTELQSLQRSRSPARPVSRT